MINFKKAISAVLAIAMSVTLAACEDSIQGGGGTTTGADGETETEARVTTTAATVEVNTETLKAEEEELLEGIMAQLPERELENKTVKWLSHYDINPDTTGKSKSVQLEMFERKYGGKIEYIPTTFETRYDDLARRLLGGEGIDIFPGEDPANLPTGIVSGMFQPVDDYIDLDSPVWDNTREAMELYNFGGKHYQFVTDVTAEAVVIYNKQTVESFGFDDPYELWQAGEWNWDTFEEMLLEYVDEDSDQWGLDGFWTEKALMLSAGTPFVEARDGGVVSNVDSPTIERAFNYQYDLFMDGLVFPREQFDWNEQPQFMGEGRQLFYLCGIWTLNGAPDTWFTQIPPEDVMIAPVPSPAGETEYQGVRLEGYVLCKGAANPEGAALFAECSILAINDAEAKAIGKRKIQDDSQWTDELYDANEAINQLARENPVVDIAAGCSADIRSLTTDGGDTVGLRAALHGYEWATMKGEISEVVQLLVSELDADIKNAIAAG